jgi:WD40 repeat protein
VWEAATGKLLHEFGDLAGPALSVAFAPDGKRLAFGTSEGAIYLWEREAGKPRLAFKGHRQAVTSLAFNPTGKLLVSGGKPTDAKQFAEFKAWDPATGEELQSQTGHRAGITGVAVSADGSFAVTAGLDGHLRFRDLMFLKRAPLLPFQGHFMPIAGVTYSPDGQLVATSSADRTVRIWNGKTGEQLQRLEHSAAVANAVFSADGKFLFTGGADKTLRKWNVATGKVATRWTFPSALMDVVQSADRKTIAVVVSRDFVHIMDADTGATVRQLKPGPERAVALSADGKWVAGTVFQKGMHIWDAATGTVVTQIGSPAIVFNTAAFSPDGKHLLTGDRDNAVCLWEVASGKEVLRYKGCTKEVHCVAFVDGGRKVLASCGAVKTPITGPRHEYVGCAVLLWDAAGKELRRWDTQSSIIAHLAASSAEPVLLFSSYHDIKIVPLER